MSIETEDRVDRMIESFTRGRHSPETEAEFARWLIDERHRQEKEKALYGLWSKPFASHKAKSHAVLKRLKARLGHPAAKRRIGSWRIGAAAAVVLLLITLSGVIYLNRPDVPTQIQVSQGKQQSQTVTYIAADSALHQVLPDHTKIWLTENSSLSYREERGGLTYADLSGEGLFEVEPKKGNSAFIVKTSVLQVKVHGTRFNVREYPGEEYTTVTLHEGSVEVILPQRSMFMEPGYLLTYMHGTGETLYDALPRNVSSQQATTVFHPLDFNKVPLYTILTEIANHYGLEFNLTQGDYLYDPITVRFDGYETPEDVMFVLRHLSGEFSYSIEGDTVTIAPR